jgi:hypothetical protein
MSKETPNTDPRQRTDWGSSKQTDKPWKGNPEKEQRKGMPSQTLKSGRNPARIRELGWRWIGRRQRAQRRLE